MSLVAIRRFNEDVKRKTKRRTFASGAVRSAGALVLMPDVVRGKGKAKPLLRIGMAADAQYADVEPAMNRYYREGAPRLADAIEEFNGLDLDFCVYLGDLIDRKWDSFDAMESVMKKSRHSVFSVLGNHDFDVPDERKSDVPKRMGIEKRYYAKEVKGIRFLFLDTTDVSTYAQPVGTEKTAVAKAELLKWKEVKLQQAKPWNGAIGKAQLKWFADELELARRSGQKVVILSHHPVAPKGSHLIWNAEEVLEQMEGCSHITGWFCGHNHAGAFAEVEGVPFVTMKGMVETRDLTAYAVMDVFEDRLVIHGKGREESRELVFGADGRSR